MRRFCSALLHNHGQYKPNGECLKPFSNSGMFPTSLACLRCSGLTQTSLQCCGCSSEIQTYSTRCRCGLTLSPWDVSQPQESHSLGRPGSEDLGKGNFHGLLYFLHHSDRHFRKHTRDLLISDWCKSGSGSHFVLTLQRLVWPSCEPACRCLKHVIVQALSVSEIQLRDVSFFIYCIIIVVKVKSYQYYY